MLLQIVAHGSLQEFLECPEWWWSRRAVSSAENFRRDFPSASELKVSPDIKNQLGQ